MKMFLVLLISCEVMSTSPAAASTTALVGGGGGDSDGGAASVTGASLMTLFLKNILNLGLGSATGGIERPEPTPAQPSTRTCDKNIIRAFIDVKVKELRPFLQDDDYMAAERDDSAAAPDDDTTIMQSPTDDVALRNGPPKESVRRYRRLRRRIHRALLRETVSNATVYLIIRTIDEMIANIVVGQCGRARGASRSSTDPAARPGDVAERPAAWRLEWQKIREKYSDLFQGNDSVPHERLNEIVSSLMEKLPSFFANVLRDGETLAEGYGTRCPPAAPRSRPLASNATGAGACRAATWICSGELRRFLLHQFKAVNESCARVLHDYLEMYKIDVNIDRVLGRKGIVDTLRDINRDAETELCKIYATKIQSLVINKGKKRDLYRVDFIDFIKNITENVKMHINQIIRANMEPIDTELKERILKDLDDNMKVELGRLASEAELTICSAFTSCNGRYTVRRRGWGGRGVFVRLQLQLDEEGAARAARPPSTNYTTFSEMPIQLVHSTLDKKWLNVTRTTRYLSEYSNTIIT